ncbi:hypothetical protein ACF07Q_28660 [Nocardiopsis dassonvillei]|uniref:hypothetical protein n=1 Tax=Nocardiopsis dassonvillei TaxID=2014 RepID=UPI0036FA90CE
MPPAPIPVSITGLAPGYHDLDVTVNGHRIGPRGLVGINLDAQAQDVPRLRLNLHMPTVTVQGEAHVVLPDSTREALVALGWTPPADGQE